MSTQANSLLHMASDNSVLPQQNPNCIHHSWHASTLLEHLNTLRQDKKLTDICLTMDDGQRITCHRAVLAAACPYFEALFTNGMEEVSADCITLHGIPGSVLNQIVDYCYTGSLQLTYDTVNSVAEVANFLQFTAVEEECVRFLQDRLTTNNSLETEQVANRLFNRQLSAQAHGVSLGNFTEVTFSREFLDFSLEQVEDFISEGVCVDSEEEVYEAVMRWVYNEEDRKGALQTLFKDIFFELMPDVYILEIAAKEPLVRENEDCLSIVKKARTFQTSHGSQPLRNSSLISSKLYLQVQAMRNYSEVLILIGDLDFKYRQDGAGRKASNLLMYDARHQQWDELPGMPFISGGTEFATTATVINNDILVCTNQHRVWQYLGCQQKWSLVANRMEERNGGYLVTLQNEAYILGGLKPIQTSRLTSVQRFDNAARQWINVAPLSNGLIHTSAAACLGKIYLIGSTTGSRYVSQMFCYSPCHDAWSNCPPLPSRLMLPDLRALNGNLYVLGHPNDFDMVMFRFDVKNQLWSNVDAPMISRYGASVAVCNNKLFLLGGRVCSEDFSQTDEFSIECFDSESEIWSIHGESRYMLNGHQTVAILNPAFSPARCLGPKQH